ncbi:CHAT domain-containing protein [Hypoxylon argillaceum]|nr:CHAT domain-containing protein [Hypoxylon argillaceum]
MWVMREYKRTRNFTDLEDTLRRTDEALAITPCHHADRASYFNSLGIMLAGKYSAAVLLTMLSIKGTPGLSPTCAPETTNRSNGLAAITYQKYHHTGFQGDLDYAIRRAEEALVAMPTDHPYQALGLTSYGDLLYCRYGQPGATEAQKWRDCTDCVSHYQQAWNSPKSPPAVRIRAAQKAAKILLRLGNYEGSNVLLHNAVSLLPSISHLDSNQQRQQYILEEFTGLTTLAASMAFEVWKEPIRSLQLLEEGRTVNVRRQLNIQTTSSAFELQQLDISQKLKCADTISTSRNYFVAATQADIATEAISKMPHLETALLSPIAAEFQVAASGGPVIVLNVSPFRCDAILIQKCSIRSLPLPSLNYKVMRQMVDLFTGARGSMKSFCHQGEVNKMLEWLWDVVASPILNELGFREPPREGDPWPHVWWMPTGLLSMLPIHAAGRHNSVLSETVVDRVISSYCPSVKVLLYQRKQTAEYSHALGEACVVSMLTTPGCSPLPTVGEEIESVKALLPALHIKSSRLLYNPRKEDVIEGLKSCDFFHFAGHAVSNPLYPSKSYLVLDDWKENPLTVESILESNLEGKTPFLAYLSACSTGAGPTECLNDESINLMTACHLIGVRHAVGSLWNLFEEYPSIAATQFYKTLGNNDIVDDHAVALAVHTTVRRIREITRNPEDSGRGAGDVFAWAAYIHIGP